MSTLSDVLYQLSAVCDEKSALPEWRDHQATWLILKRYFSELGKGTAPPIRECARWLLEWEQEMQHLRRQLDRHEAALRGRRHGD